MKTGFAKVDITPRIGVELCGFGPYRHRYSIAVRDNLWAKSFALEHDGEKMVLVSCDLIGLQSITINKVKVLVEEASGLPPESVMVHCTHTHSGPATTEMNGWGEMDSPYMEILPYKIAKSCIDALQDLQDSEFSHAEVPCEGIAYNRQYDKTGALPDVLKENWRPEKPELTDTTCHVIKVESRGKLRGFISYFGCHPVVCCEQSRYIHGDYPGVALNNLEREFPGSIGLFLQGAQGDINTCVVHKTEQESLLALDIIAARFANAVRNGLEKAKSVKIEKINSAIVEINFSEKKLDIAYLKNMLAEKESIIQKADASDEPRDTRMAMVMISCLRKIIGLVEKGEPTYPTARIQGFRIGPIVLLGGPFETYQGIKNDVKASAKSPVPLVMSLTNEYFGYAPDKETATGYAAETVPMILGHMPFGKIHEELVEVFLKLEKKLLK
ncbi:MAG: hypothetical protein A2017_08925 [Lentisphaerae bacterium GWF2_44_16]|nr:MAG: hypothetical protein A2017_08925 [Lentisphaerae bacterium GWF2_44_16]